MSGDRANGNGSPAFRFWHRAWYVEFWVSLTATIVPIIFAGVVLFDRNGVVISALFGAETDDDFRNFYLKVVIVLIALVASTILAQRFVQLEKIKISVETIEGLVKTKAVVAASASDCLFENIDMGPYVDSAQSDIVFIGINLTSLLGTTRDRLNVQLARGRRLTVGIIETDQGNLDAATRRSDIALSEAGYYRSKLETSIFELRQMTATAAKAGNGHNIKLLKLPFVPSFSLRGFDLDQATAVIIVEIYPHRTALSPPMLVVRPQTDPHWFRYFRDQVDVMLRDAPEHALQSPA